MSAGKSKSRLQSPHAGRLAPLNKGQRDVLCRAAAVPPDKRDRFINAVEKCVAVYQKSPLEVERELRQIKARVRSCLQLLDRKKWRPGEFRKGLKALSAALAGLSPRAHEYLQFRNVEVAKAIPGGWRPESSSNVIIDPICFQREDEQFEALKVLLGVLSGPVAEEKGAGRPEVFAERALYHCLAAAFTRDTDKKASDSSTPFMALCSDIKNVFHLDDWRPGSLPRSARARGAKQD